MASASAPATRQVRQANYGQRWGEGAARCFSIEGDFLDEDQGVRLMPVPDSFFCPISAAIMLDPVATVDGCAYEREYIERWFREKRQQRQPVTSPTTGLELPSTTLMPLMALQRAIEAYLAHRPELRRDHLAGRSFEEAAQVLQVDLLEKQAMNASVHDELRRLRESNRALLRALRKAEANCEKLMEELKCSRTRARLLEDEKASALSVDKGAGDILESSNVLPAAASFCSSSAPSASSTACTAASPPRPATLLPPLQSPVRPSKPKCLPASHEQGAGGLACKLRLSATNLRFTVPPQLVMVIMALLVMLLHRASLDTGRLHHEPFIPAEPPQVHKVSTTPSTNASKPKHKKEPPSRPTSSENDLPEILRQQVRLLSSGSHQDKASAALALFKVASSSSGESQAAVVEAGAVEPLVKLLEVDQHGLQKIAAAALGLLASRGPANQAEVVRHGAIPPLVRLLKGEVVLKAAVSALRNLAADNDRNQGMITQAGAVVPLVRLLREGSSDVQAEAAATLGNLAGATSDNHYEKQVTLARAGVIPPLVALLSSDSPEVLELAAGALRMLATNNADNQVAIAQAQALGPLVSLLDDDTPRVREEAAAALGYLAFYNAESHYGNQVAIVEAGAIKPLVRLLRDSAPGVQGVAVGALQRLAANNAHNEAAIAQELAGLKRLLGARAPGLPEEASEAWGALALDIREVQERQSAYRARSSRRRALTVSAVGA